jgi:hypothetical protein
MLKSLLYFLLFTIALFPTACVQAESTPNANVALDIQLMPGRRAFLRGEKNAVLKVEVSNNGAADLDNVTLKISGEGASVSKNWKTLTKGAKQIVDVPIFTLLRAGEYSQLAEVQANGAAKAQQKFSFFIAARTPDRLPVELWGFVDKPYITHQMLRGNGITRVFDLYGMSEAGIFKKGAPISPEADARTAQSEWDKLDSALVNGLELGAIFDEPTFYMKDEKFWRVNKDGTPNTKSPNVLGLRPEAIEFAENLGKSAVSWYGGHPAWTHTLLFSEARDAATVSYSTLEKDAYKKWSGGAEIPDAIETKYGVDYKTLKDFPANRVVPDDHEILQFYRWFWTQGDGWITLPNVVNREIKKARPDVTTWFDPSLRTPSLYGVGGNLDMIGHWTYTNPDPLKLAMTQDELQRMAQGGKKTIGKPYKTFQMMQLFWYGTESLGTEKNEKPRGDFDDHDPAGIYPTIGPDIFRESFWILLTRPNDMIGYHGQQALWPSDGTHAYKFTNPKTQHEMKRLHQTIATPLGPTLKKIPARKHDVAWLESFSSQMLAGRGIWGWSTYELGARYRALSHAGLQSDIVYEESINDEGLEQYKVLFLLGCDILPQSVYEKIAAWQKRGGFVIGDANTCPAIKPDYVVAPYSAEQLKAMNARPDRALDKSLILQFARELQNALKGKHASFAQSDDMEIIPYVRSIGGVDYLFAINDHRKFGDYVGQYGMIKEQGVAQAGSTLRVARPAKFAYDLVNGGAVPLQTQKNAATLKLDFEPAGGRLIALSDQQIGSLQIGAAQAGSTLALDFQLQDSAQKPMRGVWPMQVEILDPAGRVMEWSGFYGVQNGVVKINYDLAPNDINGRWQISARDLAGGKSANERLMVSGGKTLSAQQLAAEKEKVAAEKFAQENPTAQAGSTPDPALPLLTDTGEAVTKNNSFEDELQNWSVWDSIQNGEFTIVPNNQRSGQKALLVKGLTRGGPYQIFDWAPGKYYAIVRLKTPKGQASKSTAKLSVSALDENATPGGFETFSTEATTLTGDNWQELKVEFELKNDFEGKAKKVMAILVLDGLTPEENVFIDDFGVYKIP